MDRRLRAAYEKAELKPVHGGLWHPWRRKWATERDDLPVKDVAAAGGWSDTETLVRSYQQADEATVTKVVLSAPKLTRWLTLFSYRRSWAARQGASARGWTYPNMGPPTGSSTRPAST